MKCYNVLKGKVIGDFVYIFVPFASTNELRVFHLVPFPTFLNDSLVVELDNKEVIVIVNDNFDSIALTDKNQFAGRCMAIASGQYLCPANKLHFFSFY